MSEDQRHNLFSRLIFFNLALSAWLFVAENATQFAYYLRSFEILAATHPARIAAVWRAPFILAAVEVLLWVVVFSPRRPGARFVAALVGVLVMAHPVGTTLIIGHVNKEPVNTVLVVLYVYIGVSHLAWALLGQEADAD